MRKRALPTHLKSLTLRFREDEDPYERDDSGAIVEEDGEKVLREGWELDDDDKPVKTEDVDNESDPVEDDGEDDLKKKVDALEKSLRDERKVRRKIERDAKRAARKKASDTKAGEEKELQEKLDASTARTEKLAAGLLRKEIDTAIMAEARKQGFIDPSDALIDEIRREVDSDQDEDDPTDIDVDKDSVKDAVKELAGRKKHLIGSGSQGERSGGKFSRKNSKNDDKPDEQALQDRYPSLR